MDVIFSRSSSLLSKFIRIFDAGEWSHVAIKLDDNHVLDARFPRGVQIRHFDMTEYEIVKIEGDITKAMQHIGKKYDLLQFVWYGFRYGEKMWDNPNEFICSEVLSEAAHDEFLKGLTPNQQYHYLAKKK